MIPSVLLDDLRQRGVVLKVEDEDRLRVEAPRGALTPALHATLKAHKREVIEELRRYATMYEELTIDIGSLVDVEALRWMAHRHSEAILSELLALDRRCAELARCGGSEAEYREAVEALVSRVREVRRLYQEAKGGPSKSPGEMQR